MAALQLSKNSRNIYVVYDFVWKIKNLTKCQNFMNSQPFSPLNFIPIQFSLRIERNQDDNDYKVKLISSPYEGNEKIPSTLLVDTQISIRSKDEKTEKCDIFIKSVSLEGFKELFLFSFLLDPPKKTIQMNEGKVLRFDNNVMFLKCNFVFHGLPKWRIFHDRHCNIFEDFKALYDSKNMADIAFAVGGDILKAHQFVLTARSPVFNAMLNQDCLEAKTKTIQIDDADAYTLDCFLLYLYCCEIKDTSFDTLQKLYVLAEKYAVSGLKKDCAEIFTDTLSLETVCRVLELAHLLHDEELKKRAADYISSNFAEVRKTSEWKGIMDHYSDLTSEIFGLLSLTFG